MNIYDKAMWQIDAGVSKEKAVEHFVLVFEWLAEKELLSTEGKEMIEIGIDESISLHEGMVNEQGNAFLSKYYDKIISESNYDINLEKNLLDTYYSEFYN